MKRLMVFLCFFVFLYQGAWAGGPGTTNANFLKASQGVRPVAMGETYISLGQGLDTLYWNPAGLVQLGSPSVSFIHNFWFQDIGTEYLAYGTPLGPFGAIGAGVTVLHTGAIERTLEDQYGNYAGTGGTSSALSLAFVGAYAFKLPASEGFLKNTLLGASLRVVNETIADTNVFGGALDVGAIWRETEEIPSGVRDAGWRLGLVAQNLGMTTDQLMPINFRAGAGYVVNELFSPSGRGTIAADLLVPIDNTLRVSVGAEYANISENTEFAARVGYKVGSEIKDLDSMAGLTAGAGFALAAGLIKYQIDYAFVPYGELGAIHRASLTLGFLPSENVVRPAERAVEAAPIKAVPEKKAAAVQAAPVRAAVPAAAPVAPLTQLPPAAKPAAAAKTPLEVAPPVVSNADQAAKLQQALNRLQGRIKGGLLPGIRFRPGDLKPPVEAQAAMDQVGRLLEQYPGAMLTVVGFDPEPKVGVEKARAVMKYLTMNFREISPDRVSAKAGDQAKAPKNTMIGFEASEAK